MNLLLLSGNGNKGRQWLREVEATLAPLFNQTHCQDYAHWESDDPEIDVDDLTDKVSGFDIYPPRFGDGSSNTSYQHCCPKQQDRQGNFVDNYKARTRESTLTICEILRSLSSVGCLRQFKASFKLRQVYLVQ